MKTTHLSDAEFVDVAEDTLAPRRAAHVESCASCREQAGVLRVVLHDVSAVEVPEPSPLFWEHLSRRVHDEVATEPSARPSGSVWGAIRGLVPLAMAAALVVAVFSGVQLTRAVRVGHAGTPRVAERSVVPPLPGTTDRGFETTPDADNAEVWAVLTAAASTLEFDEAHDAGMHVHPATIDHAVQDLSAAERTELGRLLQSELKRSSN
jgi:hypothetical protein